MVCEEKECVTQCKKCRIVREERVCQVPYTVCKLVACEKTKLVPHPSFHLEAYCVTTKVCRRVPVCEPSCEPACPPTLLQSSPPSPLPPVIEKK
jgi:hypothetical protein